MENQQPNQNLNPASPDAPIFQLLSLRHNRGLAADMSDEDLTAVVGKLRSMVSQPQTLSAVIAGEAKAVRGASKKAKLDNLLDLL